MNKKFFWLSIIAVIVSFAGGFLLANALNRKEIDDLKAENSRLKSAPQTETDDSQTLSDEEIKQKIEEADQNPDNIDFQKNLAMALYRYSIAKRESKWLNEVAKLLARVSNKSPQDYDVVVTLGNIYLDLAIEKSSTNSEEAKAETNSNLNKARDLYAKASKLNQNDADVLTDLGLTYFYAQPPDYEKALSEFQKSLKINPKGEKTLEAIVRTSIAQGNIAEAQTNLDKLKQVNSTNQSVAFLQQQIEKEKNKNP